MTGLHNVPLDEALAVKWDKGVEEVRGDKKEWVGGPPMEEAYEEILDMINYIKDALIYFDNLDIVDIVQDVLNVGTEHDFQMSVYLKNNKMEDLKIYLINNVDYHL